MKHKHQSRKIKIIPIIILLIFLFIIINITITAINHLIFNNIIKNSNNKTTADSNPQKIINNSDYKNITNRNKIKDKIKTLEQKNLNQTEKQECTWKAIKVKIPTKVTVENKKTILKNITQTYLYKYNLEEKPFRTINKTINNKKYSAVTFFNPKNFKEFYENIKIQSWYENNNLCKYQSTHTTTEFTIKNPTNLDETFQIIKINPEEKINNLNLKDKLNISIKKNSERKIIINNSITCYHLPKKNQSLINYYSDFLKEYNELDNNDFIVFNYSNEYFSCIRPYIIIIPGTYSKTTTIKEEKVFETFKTVEKEITEIVCQ